MDGVGHIRNNNWTSLVVTALVVVDGHKRNNDQQMSTKVTTTAQAWLLEYIDMYMHCCNMKMKCVSTKGYIETTLKM